MLPYNINEMLNYIHDIRLQLQIATLDAHKMGIIECTVYLRCMFPTSATVIHTSAVCVLFPASEAKGCLEETFSG